MNNYEGSEENWSCSKCTFKNSILLPLCEICDALKDNPEESNNITKPSASSTHNLAISISAQNISHDNLFQFSDDGIMSELETVFVVESSKEKGGICLFRLSSPLCNHFSQKGSHGAKWSCGYRNIQMVSSSLVQLPDYRAVMFDGSGRVPSVIELQQWIERAWAAGFDVEGARHFGHSLQGSGKWIGATECVALLRSFGLRARVVDFAEKKEQKGPPGPSSSWDPNLNPLQATGKRSREGEDEGEGEGGDAGYDDPAAALQRWVARYYGLAGQEGAGERQERFRPPLYLQYAGHSRTIVGAVRPSSSSCCSSSPGSEVHLVLLDPAKETRALRRTLLLEHADGQGEGHGKGQGGPVPVTLGRLRQSELVVASPRRLLRGWGRGRSEEFQLVYVSAGLAGRGSSEWEAAKLILPDQPHATMDTDIDKGP